MTNADRLCIKVAVWPVTISVVGLLSFMAWRSITGASPLPNGSAQIILCLSVLVTFGAVLSANLLRVRLAR